MRRTIGVVLGLILSAFSVSLAQAQLKETTINVIGNFSGTTQSRLIEQPFWKEQIGQRSDGKIKVNFNAWNDMGLKGPEIGRLLQRGVADIGNLVLQYVSGDSPINEGSDLAGLSPSLNDLRRVVDAYDPVLAEFYDKEGLKILGNLSFQAQILYCRSEVNSLADLKGKKIRTGGVTQSDLMAAFGASGVPIAFGEVTQALQLGVIDCAITGTLGGYSVKWYEVAKHLYTLPINFATAVYLVDKEKWAKMDPAVRDFLQTNIKKMEADTWALNQEEGAVGIACNTTGPCPHGPPGGMRRVDPSPEDMRLLKQAMLETVLPRWAKRCGDACTKKWNDTVGKVTGLSATN